MEKRSLGYEAYLVPVLSFLKPGMASQKYLLRRLGRKIADGTMLDFFEAQGLIQRIDKRQRDGSVEFFYKSTPYGRRMMNQIIKTVKRVQAA